MSLQALILFLIIGNFGTESYPPAEKRGMILILNDTDAILSLY